MCMTDQRAKLQIQIAYRSNLTFETVANETPNFGSQHKERTQAHTNELDHGCI